MPKNSSITMIPESWDLVNCENFLIKKRDNKNIKTKILIIVSNDNNWYLIIGNKINIEIIVPNVPGYILKYPE